MTFVMLAGVVACGGGEADPGSSQAAAQRAARAAKLERLRGELAERRAQLRRQRARDSRRVPAAAEAREAETGAAGAGEFAQLAASLPGTVGVAIGTPGGGASDSLGSLGSGPAWSTIKVPISLAVLAERGGPDGLSPSQAEQIRAALTVSDNEAAAALYADLEAADGGLPGAAEAVTAVLREGGDSSTVTSTVGRGEFSTYGQTEWALADQQRFLGSLAAGCVVGAESSAYVLGLMGEASDPWGLGAIGEPARWKGGWGPGVDGRYLVRQMGLIETEGGVATVALAAIPDDGSFESGQAIATSLAQWLAARAPQYASTPSGCR